MSAEMKDRVTEVPASAAFVLTSRELEVLLDSPEALSAVEDWHEVQATMADGMDMVASVLFHYKRKAEICAEIARLKVEREG